MRTAHNPQYHAIEAPVPGIFTRKLATSLASHTCQQQIRLCSCCISALCSFIAGPLKPAGLGEYYRADYTEVNSYCPCNNIRLRTSLVSLCNLTDRLLSLRWLPLVAPVGDPGCFDFAQTGSRVRCQPNGGSANRPGNCRGLSRRSFPHARRSSTLSSGAGHLPRHFVGY